MTLIRTIMFALFCFVLFLGSVAVILKFVIFVTELLALNLNFRFVIFKKETDSELISAAILRDQPGLW